VTNVAFDVECTSLPYIYPWQKESKLVCLSTADDAGLTQTWFFEHDVASKTTRQCVEEITEYFSHYDRIIAHNFKFDIQWLNHLGINVESHMLWDTMVAEYLVKGWQVTYEGLKLEDLSQRYGVPAKKDTVKVYWDAGVNTPDIPARILQIYCEQDAVNAMLCFKHQTKQVIDAGLMPLLSLEMEVLKAYADMERNGMQLDLDLIERYSSDYASTLQALDEELMQLLDVTNLDSPAQISAGLFGGVYKVDGKETVQRVLKDGTVKEYERNCKVEVKKTGLFDARALKIPKVATEGQYSTSVDVLKMLKPKTEKQKRVALVLTERSRIAQLKSTYFDALPKVAIDGKVHPNINQARTKTGRTSCNRPNLQNQPRGTTGPSKLCFITRYNDT
jgi:DNA polymerase-1